MVGTTKAFMYASDPSRQLLFERRHTLAALHPSLQMYE